MLATSKAAKGAQSEAEIKKIDCPVAGCRRNLALETHPERANRLVAYCGCERFEALAVYETDKPIADIEAAVAGLRS